MFRNDFLRKTHLMNIRLVGQEIKEVACFFSETFLDLPILQAVIVYESLTTKNKTVYTFQQQTLFVNQITNIVFYGKKINKQMRKDFLIFDKKMKQKLNRTSSKLLTSFNEELNHLTEQYIHLLQENDLPEHELEKLLENLENIQAEFGSKYDSLYPSEPPNQP